jgi:hypothetical protein
MKIKNLFEARVEDTPRGKRYINPSVSAIKNITKNSVYGRVRYSIKDDNVIVGDAADHTHEDLVDELRGTHSCGHISYESNHHIFPSGQDAMSISGVGGEGSGIKEPKHDLSGDLMFSHHGPHHPFVDRMVRAGIKDSGKRFMWDMKGNLFD